MSEIFLPKIVQNGVIARSKPPVEKANGACYLFRTQRAGTILFIKAGQQTLFVNNAWERKLAMS